jgi:AraC-like DNA-binding protein
VASVAEPDRLRVDETLLDVVRALFALPRSERPGRRRLATVAVHRETVEDAKAVLSERFAERLSLEAVAREVHASPFHLARLFRRQTGLAVHEYRTQLRLRAALDRLDGGDTLAGIAVACGFASHAHLTDTFWRAFGTTPSAVRSGTPAGVRELAGGLPG